MKVIVLLLFPVVVGATQNSDSEQTKWGKPIYDGITLYKIIREKKVWGAAKTNCERQGGHLAIINSEEESKWLSELVQKEEPDEPYFHVGIHDLFIEGDFETIFGQPLLKTGFSKWRPKQPDNANGNENCGALYSDGLLGDIDCESPLMFICEWNL